jgi:3-polyprenyl-4-hydroxybenzoate decarboxylase
MNRSGGRAWYASFVSERLVRSQRAAVVELGGDVLLVGRDGAVRRIEGESAELARVVLAYVAHPRSEAELIAHVESLAGRIDDERKQVLRQLAALLVETGAITREAPAARVTGVNVVVAASGAIAVTAVPALVSALQRRGHAVEVALTPTATRFVAVEALAAILHREPHTSLSPRVAHLPVPHVTLAEWAELVLVYPASATTIARISRGDFSDLVSAIALTTRAPVVIAPSMNAAMLEAPAVQDNLARLRDHGHAIVACVPSEEVAEAPATRTPLAGAAPSPGELVTTLEALRAAGVLRRRA